MRESDIRKYAQLMGELGLTGLEIKDKDNVVRLERTYGVSAAPAPVAVMEPVQTQTVSKDIISVTSPMVGVFYQAPAENAPAYVKVGDHVRQGTVLCLIEAMKMMNEITAETDGIIEAVCVENGQVVDFGKELFRIKR
ncbi:MAG: acetyl-CoA carboxylase, biotin carboxyl carrier protein [Oscillospiraceae bacterium]|nr:acetyl-CoA carboxylase, biotin carboxyl carrier protein [Oscillospiraceae bacterium]